MPRALHLAAVSAAILLSPSVADAAVRVDATVDAAAPAGVLPKQTVTVRGLMNGKRYRIGWRVRGPRDATCTGFGSSIVVQAHRGRVRFEGLPSGSYGSSSYKGFCAGRRYDAEVVRVRRRRGETVKRFTIVGAPPATGPSAPGPTPGSSGGTERPRITFTPDTAAPPTSVPNQIAHVTGVVPGRPYWFRVVGRTTRTDCFAEGNAGHIIAGADHYDAGIPFDHPYYGMGFDLCPDTVYDVTLLRDADSGPIELLTTSFTSGHLR